MTPPFYRLDDQPQGWSATDASGNCRNGAYATDAVRDGGGTTLHGLNSVASGAANPVVVGSSQGRVRGGAPWTMELWSKTTDTATTN